jgi:starch-binding outer membrane protein, SusD/RagB family
MKVTKYPLYILLMSASCCLWSCEDFLDKDPQNEISKEAALRDIASITAALNGTYNTLSRTSYHGQFLQWYPELTGGNVKINPNGTNASFNTYSPYYGFFVDPSGGTFNPYSIQYNVLAQANNIITAIPNLVDGSDAQKNSVLGQALCLRALVHFDLLRCFAQPYNFTDNASHPGVVTLTQTPKPEDLHLRSTVAQGYQRVTEDLERAITLLSPNSDRYRFNLRSAQALLAKVNCYTGNWARAASLATEVINSSLSLATREELPLIWANTYTAKEFVLRLNLNYTQQNTLAPVWGASNTQPLMVVSQDLLNLYEPEDIRGNSGLIGTDAFGNLITLKYAFAPNIPNNVPMIRLAEVYLLRAEAYAELNRPDLARPDLNLIRKRANPAAPDILSSGPELLEEIMRERRRELAFEGNLLFDITRKKRPVERLDCESGVFQCTVNYPSPFFILPIPTGALEANALLTQNEGY